MSSKKKEHRESDETGVERLSLPYSLYLAFADVSGISLKPCGIDGRPLPEAPSFPVAGPCGILWEGEDYAPACAANHAEIIETVIELRRPNIFTCHMRLAAWAVPILHDGNPLPAAIICGGVLLREPDSALVVHLERAASEHGVDSAELVRSLGSTPVVSRAHLRATADFIFQMSAAFTSVGLPADMLEVDMPPESAEELSTPSLRAARRRETKKARIRRARAAERQNIEAEIVRLLRERDPSAALEMLTETLAGDPGSSSGRRGAGGLDAAETFARLFRMLGEGRKIPREVSEKQSHLIAATLSQKTAAKSRQALERSCREFVSISEDMTGEHRPRRVKAIQRFLEKNFSKKLTLGSVGKKYDMKEKALDSLMRKHFGMSFTDYITSLRISQAKRILLTSELSMGEIARRTGFKDQSYFTKVFKAEVGSTPTEFRKKKGKQKQGSRPIG
jgi:two-component system response regulator YesN